MDGQPQKSHGAGQDEQPRELNEQELAQLLQQPPVEEKPMLREMIDRSLTGDSVLGKAVAAPLAAVNYLKNISLVPNPNKMKFVP